MGHVRNVDRSKKGENDDWESEVPDPSGLTKLKNICVEIGHKTQFNIRGQNYCLNKPIISLKRFIEYEELTKSRPWLNNNNFSVCFLIFFSEIDKICLIKIIL